MTAIARDFILRAWEERGTIWKQRCLRAESALAAASQRATEAEARAALLETQVIPALEAKITRLTRVETASRAVVEWVDNRHEFEGIPWRWEEMDALRVVLGLSPDQPTTLQEAARAVLAFNEYDACSPDNMGQAYLTPEYVTALCNLGAALNADRKGRSK